MAEWQELRFPIPGVDGTTTMHAIIYSVPQDLGLYHDWEHEEICGHLVRPYYERTTSSTFFHNGLKVETRVVVDRDSFEILRNDGQMSCGVSYLVGPLERFYPIIPPITAYWEAEVLEWTKVSVPVECSYASLQSTGGRSNSEIDTHENPIKNGGVEEAEQKDAEPTAAQQKEAPRKDAKRKKNKKTADGKAADGKIIQEATDQEATKELSTAAIIQEELPTAAPAIDEAHSPAASYVAPSPTTVMNKEAIEAEAHSPAASYVAPNPTKIQTMATKELTSTASISTAETNEQPVPNVEPYWYMYLATKVELKPHDKMSVSVTVSVAEPASDYSAELRAIEAGEARIKTKAVFELEAEPFANEYEYIHNVETVQADIVYDQAWYLNQLAECEELDQPPGAKDPDKMSVFVAVTTVPALEPVPVPAIEADAVPHAESVDVNNGALLFYTEPAPVPAAEPTNTPMTVSVCMNVDVSVPVSVAGPIAGAPVPVPELVPVPEEVPAIEALHAIKAELDTGEARVTAYNMELSTIASRDYSSSQNHNYHLYMGPQEVEEEEMHYISNDNIKTMDPDKAAGDPTELKDPDKVAELLLLKDPDKGLELLLQAIKTKKYSTTIRCKEAG